MSGPNAAADSLPRSGAPGRSRRNAREIAGLDRADEHYGAVSGPHHSSPPQWRQGRRLVLPAGAGQDSGPAYVGRGHHARDFGRVDCGGEGRAGGRGQGCGREAGASDPARKRRHSQNEIGEGGGGRGLRRERFHPPGARAFRATKPDLGSVPPHLHLQSRVLERRGGRARGESGALAGRSLEQPR